MLGLDEGVGDTSPGSPPSNLAAMALTPRRCSVDRLGRFKDIEFLPGIENQGVDSPCEDSVLGVSAGKDTTRLEDRRAEV